MPLVRLLPNRRPLGKSVLPCAAHTDLRGDTGERQRPGVGKEATMRSYIWSNVVAPFVTSTLNGANLAMLALVLLLFVAILWDGPNERLVRLIRAWRGGRAKKPKRKD